MLKRKNLRIALLCGGPSLERGISLNSARSVLDHLHGDDIEIIPIYFDHLKRPFLISRAQLYSNTPSDFDFKLNSLAQSLSKKSFREILKKVDLAFPAIHGSFGEDGELQTLLEKNTVSFVGSSSAACKKCFDKFSAAKNLETLGFFRLPSALLKIYQDKENKKIIREFFSKNKLKKAIIKPSSGGSSIGVHAVNSPKEAELAMEKLFSKRMDTRLILEPFCEGKEFTVIILENKFGLPTAILPTEMEMDYSLNQVFDYRRKYLPTNQVVYHCPPRFPTEIIEKIQIQAEQLFKAFGLNDFARFDGWVLSSGEIWFSDFNPISGMEQNSFLFMQSSQIGFSHRDLLRFVVRSACLRQGINFPEEKIQKNNAKIPVNILFGGQSSERQVSVMSGTNSWLKLRKSSIYEPFPYLLDLDNKTVFRLPYSRTLNHTVEEISTMCHDAEEAEKKIAPLRNKILQKLAVSPSFLHGDYFVPEKISLREFISRSNYIFIALHGDIGENGVLQKILEDAGKKFNGSSSKSSALCMDKYLTGEKLKNLEKEGIYIPKKKLLSRKELLAFDAEKIRKIWLETKKEFGSPSIIIKPRSDGCSSGIVKLTEAKDLATYIEILRAKRKFIKAGTFLNQYNIIEMPTNEADDFILEQFIETDKVRIIKDKLKWQSVSDWIEITMGVIGKEKMRALNPSITVALNNVLSLEEKFQGGTGINITPPPEPYVKKSAIQNVRARMEKVAETLGISGYARIDAFMQIKTGELIIIEANTLPGLTPSTVFYHQGLAENPPMYPLNLLETIIKNS